MNRCYQHRTVPSINGIDVMGLPEIPNRSEIYYKITNTDECHKGLQYHDGLVVDPKEFDNDLTHSCTKGGIYFTTKEHLHKFINYGKWIRPVTIPEGAQVILDPQGDKYRANKLFLHPRKSMKFYFTDLFNKRTFPKAEYWYLARYCPEHFGKWFDKNTFPKENYWYLAVCCPKHSDKWFDKDTFPETNYWDLAKFYKFTEGFLHK